MEQDAKSNKVEAIYNLREAVEEKARVEQTVDADPSPENRDALLAAHLNVEAKTQDAIEVCHECEEEHPVDRPHGAWKTSARGNVTDVDFRAKRR